MATSTRRRRTSPNDRPPAASTATTELLPLPEVLKELKVPRSTFYGWLQRGQGPKCIKYPNSKIMVRRCDLDAWLAAQEVGA